MQFPSPWRGAIDPLGWREWAGIGGVLVGVCTFLVAASPESGNPEPSGDSWLLGLLPITIAIAVAVHFGARSKGPARAMSLAAAAGLAFGVLAVLTKPITYTVREGAGQVLTSWQLYAAVVCGIEALVLSQSAYQSGPLAYSMPIVAITEPIAAVILGATILGEEIFLGGLALLVEFLAVVLACTGIGLLATTPTVLSIYEEGVSPATHSSEGHGPDGPLTRPPFSEEVHPGPRRNLVPPRLDSGPRGPDRGEPLRLVPSFGAPRAMGQRHGVRQPHHRTSPSAVKLRSGSEPTGSRPWAP